MSKEIFKESFTKDAKSLAPEVFGSLVGLIAFGAALFLGYLINSSSVITLADYIQLIVATVIAITLGFSVYVQMQKEKFDESEVYLKSSVDLINKAYDVLDGEYGVTADRISWVTAARLLTRATDLSAKISLPSHKSIYESEHDYQRHRFSNLLKVEGKNLPGEFFLGPDYVLGSIGKSAYSTTKDNGSSWIPARIVSTVYRFKMFPEEYRDPLDSSTSFSNVELERMWILDEEGVQGYMHFRDTYFATPGNVFKKTSKTKSEPITAELIDKEMGNSPWVPWT